MVAHSLHEEGKESSLHEVGEESTEAPSAEEPALEPGSDEEASPKEPGLQVIEVDYMLCEVLIQSVHDKQERRSRELFGRGEAGEAPAAS